MMLLIWHEGLGTDDEQATDDELWARVLYSYDDDNDNSNVLSSLHLVQGLLAFVRTCRRSGDGDSMKETTTTAWTPEWASVTLSRRRFFILEVEQQIFMALGVHPTVEIKDHRRGYEALLREIYGMFGLFHGSIESNLRLLPSGGRSVESDMTPQKNTDGMDLLMDIAAVRKRLRKLRLAIDSLTYHKPLNVTSEDTQQDEEYQQEKKTMEAELEALMALSPATTLQKKCAGFFPPLLQTLNVRSSSAFSELQGLGYFPMDQPTFLALQTFVNGFHTDLRSSESDVGAESMEKLALFYKGNLLWSSLETTTMHLLYKFLRLREERGMTMLRGDDKHDVDYLHPGLTLPKHADSELWMANAYEDTFLPVWSSKLSYTECDVVAQSKDGRPRVRKSACSLHKQHPVSLSTFISAASPSSGDPVSTPRPGLAAEPLQFCPPSHSPASLTRFGGARRNETRPANLQSAMKTRARSPSFRNAGLMLKNGCFSKLLHANREMQSGKVWREIERVWSPLIYLLDGVSTSIANTTSTMMAARHRVVVWHEADLTMIILLRLDATEPESTGAVPTSLNADTMERLKNYLEEQQRFETLAHLILARYTATFAFQKNIPRLPPLSPFVYINRVNLAFRMQQVPRLLKSKEDDMFPIPDHLLVHYFPSSTTALVNDLHAKLHGSISTGNREICVLTRDAGWVFAKKSETSHRELYVFIDSKVGSSVYSLTDSLQRLLHDQFDNVLF
ncbi:unnamed protein product [Peronospora farinosa]|uniref:CCZ1/INTU/HSP4 first Longin domain-containing protein n=1 Tax=Peronospora farinosa TaxID=134698 RepID=A0ABN8C4K0_9STRA|nr:unnamed protein product [Peronospora farinosa]